MHGMHACACSMACSGHAVAIMMLLRCIKFLTRQCFTAYQPARADISFRRLTLKRARVHAPVMTCNGCFASMQGLCSTGEVGDIGRVFLIERVIKGLVSESLRFPSYQGLKVSQPTAPFSGRQTQHSASNPNIMR